MGVRGEAQQQQGRVRGRLLVLLEEGGSVTWRGIQRCWGSGGERGAAL